MIHKELILSLADEQLVLYGNLSVLGLLLMKNKTIAPPDADSADFSIFKFMQVRGNHATKPLTVVPVLY